MRVAAHSGFIHLYVSRCGNVADVLMLQDLSSNKWSDLIHVWKWQFRCCAFGWILPRFNDNSCSSGNHSDIHK